MRLLSLTSLLFIVAAFSGCKDNTKQAVEIIEAAKNGKVPSSDEVSVVYKQLKKEGSKLSESEVGEMLNLFAKMKKETDPVKLQAMSERLSELVQKVN